MNEQISAVIHLNNTIRSLSPFNKSLGKSSSTLILVIIMIILNE